MPGSGNADGDDDGRAQGRSGRRPAPLRARPSVTPSAPGTSRRAGRRRRDRLADQPFDAGWAPLPTESVASPEPHPSAPAAPPAAPRPETPAPRPARRRDDQRAARRTVVLVTAAAGALAIGVLVLAAAGLANRQRENLQVQRSVEEAGPVAGTALDAYIEEREAALADEPGRRVRVAIVSLVHYDDAAGIEAILDDVERETGIRLESRALLAAAPGMPGDVVRGDLDEWIEERRVEAAAERAEIERLLPTVEPGTEFAEFYAEELARFDLILAALTAEGELVHGVVVEGPVGTLRRLAMEGEVRLVDLVDGRITDETEVRGVRPEETSVAGVPPRRPAPPI